MVICPAVRKIEPANIYAGLYYPMIVASITFVVGSLLLRETHGTKIWSEVGTTPQVASGD